MFLTNVDLKPFESEPYKYFLDVSLKSELILRVADTSLCDESLELALLPQTTRLPPLMFPHLNSETFVLMEIQSP